MAKGSYENALPEIKASFKQSIDVLSKFAEITYDVTFPDFPFTAILWTILGAEGSAAFRELIDSGQMREMRNQGDRIGGYIGNTISAVDYLQAMRVRKLAPIALENTLDDYDALVGPSSGSFPGLVTESFRRRATQTPSGKLPHSATEAALVPAGNIAGLPGITVPNGFSKDKLPSGIQFLGSAWSEKTLIDIANSFQRATDWHTKRPPVEKI